MQSSFQGKIQKERIVHTNWSSDKPSVDDFLNFIKSPFHVSQLKSCLREHITFHTIGNYEIALERKYFDLHSEEYEKILEVKKICTENGKIKALLRAFIFLNISTKALL